MKIIQRFGVCGTNTMDKGRTITNEKPNYKCGIRCGRARRKSYYGAIYLSCMGRMQRASPIKKLATRREL